jgi:hypothetical protein
MFTYSTFGLSEMFAALTGNNNNVNSFAKTDICFDVLKLLLHIL